MAYRVLNGVNQLATGTGTGALTLGSVLSDVYQTLAAAGFTNGDTTHVRIQHETIPSEWEIVLITYGAPSTITPTFDGKSESPTDDLISFTAGNKIVTSVITAGQVVTYDENDDVALRGALDVTDTEITSENLVSSYVVSNLAALKALTARPAAVIVLTGKAAGLWGWVAGSSATADDALFVQCTSGTAGRYMRAVHGGYADPDWWGAVGDGATNDAAAIQGALDSGYKLVKLRAGATFAVSSTVTQPVGVTVDGQIFLPGNPKVGTVIIGGAAVSPIWDMEGGVNGTSGIKNLTVSRVAGTPSAGLIGIRVLEQYNTQIENVCSDNSGLNWVFEATPSPSGLGLGINLINCHTTRWTDAAVVVDGYPEVYWIGGRFGQNGAGDYSGSSCHVRYQGGANATAGGPNSIKFESVQFNPGSNPPNYFAEFVDLADPYPGVGAVIFLYSNCHIENIDTAIFFSDSSWNVIDNLVISQCFINCPSTPMFALNAASQPNNWEFHGAQCFVSTFNLAPTNQINTFKMFGGYISGTTSIAAGAGGGATVLMIGTGHGGNVAISGAFGAFNALGMQFTAGAFSSTATGNIFYDGAVVTQRRWKRLAGTADGSGDLVVAHGISSAALVGFSIAAAYKAAGPVWTPMTVNFMDNANVSVSGGAPAASLPVQILIEYSDTVHSGW